MIRDSLDGVLTELDMTWLQGGQSSNTRSSSQNLMQTIILSQRST